MRISLFTLIFIISFQAIYAQLHPISITSEVGSCNLIIDDSVKITVPKSIKISEGLHKFHFINESLNILFEYKITKFEHFRINKDKVAFLDIDKIKSDFRFSKQPDTVYVHTTGRIDTLDLTTKNNFIRICPMDSVVEITAPGYIPHKDTLALKPFLFTKWQPSLHESDSLKYKLILFEEARRKEQKLYATIGLSISNFFFIYKYFNPNDKSELYYQEYLSGIEPDDLAKKYDIYVNEINRVNHTKNICLSAIIINTALLTYVVLFENYTDLSAERNRIYDNLSLSTFIGVNQFYARITVEF